MARRHPNHRLVKRHRSYRLEEIARLLGKHKNTVREWIKVGLPTIDNKRPKLILGHELIAFLKARRVKNKTTLRPGQMYCVRCRAPKFPTAGTSDFQCSTDKIGNLTAICPDCESFMNLRVSVAKIREFSGEIDLTFPQALRQIGEISRPSVNSDLKGDIQL